MGLDSGTHPSAASTLPSTPLTSAKPAPTVPNTVAVKSANTTDVAALSQQPGRVDATSRPTSQPISAVVQGRDQGSGIREQPAPGTTAAARKKNKAEVATAENALPARAATPTADGETSLVRALGLKIGRIVIDAGHGGHDSGTLGVDGIQEKDVVLDVALRLGKLLHDRLGAEIIYTRSDDTFIPLETRTAIANKAQADLFLSIHANSSPDESARGVETYYLNFTTSPDSLQTAARENAVSNQSIHQLSDLVKKITLRDKIDESREFATDVEQSLYSGLQKGNEGLKNRGVKKAPFVVLIGANMPSILAEISFVTNPRDAEQLQLPQYRQRVAESLYKGVAKYEAGLSGARTPTLRASAGTK
jgi:N-acetylmuramoyl-L-alanine amidase